MAGVPLWPIESLSPREFSLQLAARTLAGPSSISGVSQVVASDAGIWRLTLGSIPVLDQRRVILWRTLSGLAEGRMNPFLVPVTRFYQPYAPEWTSQYEPAPHTDAGVFNDGSEYQGAVIDVTLASNIPVRGTTANIAIHVAHEIQPGQHFSIGERLYRIRTIEKTGEGAATITFRPPAREAATIGTRLEFDLPVCRMRLASDNEMDLALDYGRWAFPSVNFIEDV
jgi:hypothetical protein